MKVKTIPRTLRILFALLIAVTALKILIVGYDIDEQYALSMSYRMVKGDFPVRDMWEPHQTSGFLAAILMIPYLFITKSTAGIVLYLRFCGLILQGFTAFLFYRCSCFVLRRHTSIAPGLCRDFGVLIACIYFFSLPKLMFFPEFSNMQLWFLLLMILCLARYEEKGSRRWLLGAGFFLALEVLSYPSTILLYPVCLYYILRHSRMQASPASSSPAARKPSRFTPLTVTNLLRKNHAACFALPSLAVFSLPCIAGAFLFVGYLLTGMSIGNLATLAPIVASDGSHSATLREKLLLNGKSLGEILAFFLVYSLLALLFSVVFFKKISLRYRFAVLLFLTTLTGQMVLWIFGSRYPNYPSLEYLLLPAASLLLHLCTKQQEDGLLFLYVCLPLTAFAGIVVFTNHPLLVSAPFLGLCAAGSVLWILIHVRGHDPALRGLLLIWVIVLLFGKCYMVRTTGGMHYTLFDSLSRIQEGPAAGIIADSRTVLRYQETTALLEECAILDNANVFYIGNANDLYLMQNMEFSTPSTISSPTFDEKVELYFAMHPEKRPEYVICNSELTSRDNGTWLAGFLQNNCPSEPLAENDYIKIYKTVY